MKKPVDFLKFANLSKCCIFGNSENSFGFLVILMIFGCVFDENDENTWGKSSFFDFLEQQKKCPKWSSVRFDQKVPNLWEVMKENCDVFGRSQNGQFWTFSWHHFLLKFIKISYAFIVMYKDIVKISLDVWKKQLQGTQK